MSTKSTSATATEVQCVTDLFENLRSLSIQPRIRTQSQWIVPVKLVQLAQSKLAQQSEHVQLAGRVRIWRVWVAGNVSG